VLATPTGPAPSPTRKRRLQAARTPLRSRDARPTSTFSHPGLLPEPDRPRALDGSPRGNDPCHAGRLRADGRLAGLFRADPDRIHHRVRARAVEPGRSRAGRSPTRSSSGGLPSTGDLDLHGPRNFFDDEIGIYVLGTDYDPSSRTSDPISGGLERPVHIELFETDGTLGFSADAGRRSSAGGAAATPAFPGPLRPKPVRGEPFRTHLPDKDIDSFESFVLRNSGNDWGSTHFRDALMTSLVADRVDHQAYRPAVVFLNGEYWGS